MTLGGQPIKVDNPSLQQAVGGPPPPPIPPVVPPVPGQAPLDNAGAAAIAATGLGIPGDEAGSTQADLDRRAHAADAAAKFDVNEANSTQEMQGVGAQAPQMMQQMLSSITGALGGAMGGVMGPLTQLPQQAMQAGQSAIQPLMSAVQGASHGTAALADESHLVDSVGGESGLGGGSGGGGGAGLGGGGTTPASSLGPPPVPTSSPPTTPAGAPAKPVAVPPTTGTPSASGPTGMTGMPMMPPGAMGAGGEGANKDKPADKRVTAPGVPNGQPVKGRLTMPPGAPAAKHAEAKPTVVTNRPNRRIVIMPSEDEAPEKPSE